MNALKNMALVKKSTVLAAAIIALATPICLAIAQVPEQHLNRIEMHPSPWSAIVSQRHLRRRRSDSSDTSTTTTSTSTKTKKEHRKKKKKKEKNTREKKSKKEPPPPNNQSNKFSPNQNALPSPKTEQSTDSLPHPMEQEDTNIRNGVIPVPVGRARKNDSREDSLFTALFRNPFLLIPVVVSMVTFITGCFYLEHALRQRRQYSRRRSRRAQATISEKTELESKEMRRKFIVHNLDFKKVNLSKQNNRSSRATTKKKLKSTSAPPSPANSTDQSVLTASTASTSQERKMQTLHSSACTICLKEYANGEHVGLSRNPECVHTFHKDCIVEWLMEHDDCPCCRKSYFAAL